RGKTRSLVADLTGGYFAFALRRAAQYFFIRSDTALRAAGDMVRRRRLRPPPAAPSALAALDEVREPRRPRAPNKSGNALPIAASSRRSSSRRDFAPSRASRSNSSLVKSATYPPWTISWPRQPTR